MSTSVLYSLTLGFIDLLRISIGFTDVVIFRGRGVSAIKRSVKRNCQFFAVFLTKRRFDSWI